MAIVIARTGEAALAAAPLTQEQKDSAWAAIVKAWAEKHPDALRALLEDAGKES